MPKGAKPTEEVISRLELENKPPKHRKKTRVIKTQPITSTPESQKPEEPKKPKVTSSNRTQSWQRPERASTKPAVTPAAEAQPRQALSAPKTAEVKKAEAEDESSTLMAAQVDKMQDIIRVMEKQQERLLHPSTSLVSHGLLILLMRYQKQTLKQLVSRQP